MEIIGKVVRLGNLTEGTSARGPWRKQELIIETEEQYPRTVCLICWTNQIDEIQKFAPGQTIKAQIEISSREFNGKWYTDRPRLAFRPRWRCSSHGSSCTASAATHDAPDSACRCSRSCTHTRFLSTSGRRQCGRPALLTLC